MPGFDGTGPSGKGPLTGRGLGKCGGKLGTAFAALALPAIGAVINDIRKPDGLTRRLFASLKSKVEHRMLKHSDVGHIDEENGGEVKNG